MQVEGVGEEGTEEKLRVMIGGRWKTYIMKSFIIFYPNKVDSGYKF
jgi:hypothetical protein